MKNNWLLIEHFNGNSDESYFIDKATDCMDLQSIFIKYLNENRDVEVLPFFGGDEIIGLVY